MKRRNFIKLSASASALGLLPLELNAMLKNLDLDPCDYSNRKLVLINLAGANDGLNTVVPLNQYGIYSNLRPDIKVPETGTNSYITLDSTLPDNQQVGLNPAMTGFKSIYDQGWLRVIQSVGYPSQNKSHFASTDIYLTGNDGNNWLNGSDSGLIGRFMETYYQSELTNSYPLAVQLGSNSASLGFHGELEHGMALNITGQDPSGFYSILDGLGGAPPSTIPNTHYGEELNYIIQTDALSNQYAQQISDAFNNGSNTVTYDDTNLADQLKTVAKLISGGLESKVYLVTIGGFDTHGSQVQSSGNPLGEHYDLLNNLSNSINSFLTDLNSQNLGDDVVGLTYSEFGRKAAQNGGLGTDHGEVSPMFVFGKPVQGGVSGINPDLTEATSSNNYQIKTVQHDYRHTFATLLQDFLAADNTIIDNAFFDNTNDVSFLDAKISNLIKPDLLVPPSCYSNSLSIDSIASPESFLVYPNPFNDHVKIKSSFNLSEYTTFLVVDLNGKIIIKGNSRIETENLLHLSLEGISSGIYILNVMSNKDVKTFKIVKK